MTLAGKTVVITGAGRGIGRGFAIGFAGDGAQVVGFGRTERDLQETAKQCGGRMHAVVGDLASEADVARLFAEAERMHGKVDVLVNNAAVYPKQLFLESSQSEWAHAFATNVLGLAHCCRLALPGMLARGHGRIVNLGSFAWKGPIPASSAYCSSKAAVTVFTKALAGEVDRARHPDVLINELLAGVYKTAMSDVGDPPAAAYPFVRRLALLPSGGPHGQMFLRDELLEEPIGRRERLRRLFARLRGGNG